MKNQPDDQRQDQPAPKQTGIRTLLSILLAGGLVAESIGGCQTKRVYEPVADRDGIRHIVREHLPEARECYEKAIEERPGAEGKIVMNWDIQPDGSTANVKIKTSDPKIEGVGPCLKEALERWNFPRLTKDEVAVNVSYPFVFSENGNFRPLPNAK